MIDRKTHCCYRPGGVGKTTTVVNLSAAIASMGKRVLLVDSDPQGNASSGVGFVVTDQTPTTYEAMLSSVPIETAFRPTDVPDLDRRCDVDHHGSDARADLVTLGGSLTWRSAA